MFNLWQMFNLVGYYAKVLPVFLHFFSDFNS